MSNWVSSLAIYGVWEDFENCSTKWVPDTERVGMKPQLCCRTTQSEASDAYVSVRTITTRWPLCSDAARLHGSFPRRFQSRRWSLDVRDASRTWRCCQWAAEFIGSVRRENPAAGCGTRRDVGAAGPCWNCASFCASVFQSFWYLQFLCYFIIIIMHTDQAQGRESPPAIDQRLNHLVTPPTMIWGFGITVSLVACLGVQRWRLKRHTLCFYDIATYAYQWSINAENSVGFSWK